MDVLIDGVTETVKNEIKKVGFLGALLAALVTSLVKPVISSIVKDISREELEEQEEDVWLKCFSSAPSFKQYRDYYFNDEPRFNSLPRIKDGAYVINLYHKSSKGTHSVSLFVDKNIAIYFDSFWIEYIPQDVLN